MTLRIGLSSIILAAMIFAVASAYNIGRAKNPPAQFVTAQTVASQPALPGFTLTFTGSGTLSVPNQVAPGTYLVGPSDSLFGCTWQTLRRNDDDPTSIIDWGQMPRGAAGKLITVKKTDRYVRAIGGCAFQKAS